MIWDSDSDDDLPPPSVFSQETNSRTPVRFVRRDSNSSAESLSPERENCATPFDSTFQDRLRLSPELVAADADEDDAVPESRTTHATTLIIDTSNDTSGNSESDDEDIIGVSDGFASVPGSRSHAAALLVDTSNDTSGNSESDDEDLVVLSDRFSSMLSPKDRNIPSSAKKVENQTGDSAWMQDTRTGEYFLSADKFCPTGVTWPLLRIPSELYDRLYPYQREGVQWVAGLHSNSVGGILGDDMGLGKTYQTLTCLGGLMRAGTIKNALVVAPLSVLRTWENEAKKIISKCCLPRVTIIVLSSDIKRDRRCRYIRDALTCSKSFPYLIITTYGLVGNCPQDFVRSETWDYVVLDEGHKIKNPSTNFSKACVEIAECPSTHRLMLTGTPIPNNLKELWAVFDWATSGMVLGNKKSFEAKFAGPIEDGRMRNASGRTLELAEKANRSLQELLRPFFLQRLKSVVLQDLPPKSELVVWTHLSSEQRDLYEEYVDDGETVKSILGGEKKSPLEALSWLKKLCGHPLLVDMVGEYDPSIVEAKDPKELLKQSSKLQVLYSLVTRLKASGHRSLIFSQSTRMLDIIQHVLKGAFVMSRIDGSTSEKHRQRRVEAFNDDKSTIDVILLSTRAASLGLTLVGADRAIIYDPSWTPTEDAQAVDRCYRIGQKKEVTVYRFITAGTVEEKMYERQVHKDGIRRQVLTNVGSALERHFDKAELKQLFRLGAEGICEFLQKFQSSHPKAPFGSSGKPSILASHDGVIGVSSHDIVYSESKGKTDTAPPTPFGGSPAPKVLGRSQRALMSAQKDEENSANKENDEPATPRRLTDVKSVLERASVLHKAGKSHHALNMLLDLAESGEASGVDKITMHQQIASVTDHLHLMIEGA